MVLSKAPEEILAEKNFNTVPYMVGITKKEFGWITPMVRPYRTLSGTHRASVHTTHLFDPTCSLWSQSPTRPEKLSPLSYFHGKILQHGPTAFWELQT